MRLQTSSGSPWGQADRHLRSSGPVMPATHALGDLAGAVIGRRPRRRSLPELGVKRRLSRDPPACRGGEHSAQTGPVRWSVIAPHSRLAWRNMKASAAALIKRMGAPNAVYTSRYGILYDDNVEGTDGRMGTYLRWVWAGAGVVVVPTDGQRLYLWPMYRYPIGAQSLEFPRGAGEAGESPEEAAARELSEETGFTPVKTKVLGLLHADTGLIANSASIVLAHIDAARPGLSRLEATEAVTGSPIALTVGGMADLIRDGRITCALTITAYVHAIPYLRATT
jgi:ADP-ribose pyrophosphatase YjhB (NUDIX family)